MQVQAASNSGSLFGRLDAPAAAVLFSGLGGACEGIRQALGVSPIVAINHDDHAIRLHKRNHPDTLHFAESVFDVAPLRAARGRRIKLLWLSPDCTHFSRAKGGKPVEHGRRSLAAVAVYWARDVRPDVIMLENVQEFLSWGPLYPMSHPDPKRRGQPIPERKGEFFRAWKRGLERHGYIVEWRVLCAADYGAPTSRH